MPYNRFHPSKEWRYIVSGYQNSVENKAKEAIKTAIYESAVDVILQYEKAKPDKVSIIIFIHNGTTV